MVSAGRPIYDKTGGLRGVLVADILLSDLGARLREAVGVDKGYAFIVEKNAGTLVANSLGLDNFSVSPSGALKRYRLDELEIPVIRQVFKRYEANPSPQMFVRSSDLNLHVNAREYHREGLDWIILTVIPETFLMADVLRNIQMTALLVVVAIALSLAIYYAITIKLYKPMDNLLAVAERIASGNLSERAQVVRRDEIGRISSAFNRTADKMLYLINHLEDMVKAKTADLEANKDQLRLLLDSTAEGIYGVDLDGNCTFCNKNCLQLLGYVSESDLLGRNMHQTIHHTRADGTPFPASECGITKSIRLGVGRNADDEVFWKADGTWFFAEYYAYPQMQDGAVTGAVITFMDITQRKKHDEEIGYLSSHDVLTGLRNRWYFQRAIKQIDVPENLPLSVIFGDLNGLKMTNDIFGHAAGDALVIKASEILVRSCREGDTIARVGGDEFVILLPKTDTEDALKITERIRRGFDGARVAAVKCSISLGCDTKTSPETSVEEAISNAENAMYKDKTLNRKSINKGMIDTIMEALHEKSPKEKRHSIFVSDLCGRIGVAMKLPDAEVNKMRQAGYLHDIGKIALEEHVLHWDDLGEVERERIHQHSAVGYRILNLFDDTLDLAEGVYSHHERWDGTGYPKGLKGSDIPLLSRVISVAETYERVSSGADSQEPGSKEKALQVIREGAGKQFDPQIADLLIRMMEKDA
jgi:diguanylate cyclase (GGDEF)-like protein/PAS domain S-box-containing protein/putative nucleotidyltransferase with HDIG domain